MKLDFRNHHMSLYFLVHHWDDIQLFFILYHIHFYKFSTAGKFLKYFNSIAFLNCTLFDSILRTIASTDTMFHVSVQFFEKRFSRWLRRLAFESWNKIVWTDKELFFRVVCFFVSFLLPVVLSALHYTTCFSFSLAPTCRSFRWFLKQNFRLFHVGFFVIGYLIGKHASVV